MPSLDTPTCDIETRWFNEEAAKLGPGVEILTISMDLPFAQKRWCGAAGVERVTTYSDHRDAAFGQAYGVLIKELRLLARAVFVVDQAGTLRYVQVVKEVANEPNYDEVLAAVSRGSGAQSLEPEHKRLRPGLYLYTRVAITKRIIAGRAHVCALARAHDTGPPLIPLLATFVFTWACGGRGTAPAFFRFPESSPPEKPVARSTPQLSRERQPAAPAAFAPRPGG